MFTSVTCDLDTRRITDFRLKPWAERYLVLRATLYDAAEATIAETKKTPSQREGVQQDMPLSGNAPYPGYFYAQFTVNPYILPRLPRPKPPESPEKQNLRVKAKFLREQGLSYPEIAQKLRISLGAAWALINKPL